MTANRWLLAATALLLVISAVACSRGRSDAQLVSDVINKINADSHVTNKQISVAADNGIVTLTGSAASDAERAAAANDAAHVEGVKTVVNNLLLPAAPAPVEEANEQPAEEPQPVVQPRPAPSRKPSAYRAHQQASSTPKHTDTAANNGGGLSGYPIATDTSATSTPLPGSTSTTTTAAAIPAAMPAPSLPAPPPPPTPVTIQPGTTLSIRMNEAIDSGRNHPGDMFHATLEAPITIDDKVVVPEGADIVGRIVDAKEAGHFAGQPQLALELTSLSMNGRKYSLVTSQYTQQGKSRGSRTAKTVGSGAAIGAIIGAIAGGGKGAAIGAAAGAGMGGGVEAATKPEQVHIATEALLQFRLQSPLTVTPVAVVERPRTNSTANWTPAPPSHNSGADNTSVDNSGTYDSTTSDSTSSDSDRPVLKRRPKFNSGQQ